MANLKFDKDITPLLVIDPYNDFISEGGKVWDRLKTVSEAKWLCASYVASPECCAEGGASSFDALHRRYRPGDYETWKYIAPVQKAGWLYKTFENGT
jgi:hypothetical protein